MFVKLIIARTHLICHVWRRIFDFFLCKFLYSLSSSSKKILNCFGLCLQSFWASSLLGTLFIEDIRNLYIQDIPVTAFYGCPLKNFSWKKKTLKSRGALFCGVTSRFKSVENGREWHWKRGKGDIHPFPSNQYPKMAIIQI